MTIESQRSGAALPESEEHYRAVAEAATDAIITIDSDSTHQHGEWLTDHLFGGVAEDPFSGWIDDPSASKGRPRRDAPTTK